MCGVFLSIVFEKQNQNDKTEINEKRRKKHHSTHSKVKDKKKDLPLNRLNNNKSFDGWLVGLMCSLLFLVCVHFISQYVVLLCYVVVLKKERTSVEKSTQCFDEIKKIFP